MWLACGLRVARRVPTRPKYAIRSPCFGLSLICRPCDESSAHPLAFHGMPSHGGHRIHAGPAHVSEIVIPLHLISRHPWPQALSRAIVHAPVEGRSPKVRTRFPRRGRQPACRGSDEVAGGDLGIPKEVRSVYPARLFPLRQLCRDTPRPSGKERHGVPLPVLRSTAVDTRREEGLLGQVDPRRRWWQRRRCVQPLPALPVGNPHRG